jgi:hypothetical protein
MFRIIASGLVAAAVGLLGGWTLISVSSEDALSSTVEAPSAHMSAAAIPADDGVPATAVAKTRPARPSETPAASQPGPAPAADPDQVAPSEPTHRMRRQKPPKTVAARDEDDDD